MTTDKILKNFNRDDYNFYLLEVGNTNTGEYEIVAVTDNIIDKRFAVNVIIARKVFCPSINYMPSEIQKKYRWLSRVALQISLELRKPSFRIEPPIIPDTRISTVDKKGKKELTDKG